MIRALLWKATGLGNGYGSVAAVGGTIYVTGEADGKGILSALTATGKRKWTCVYGREHTGVYPGARCTPTVFDGRVYLVSGTGEVCCVGAAEGKLEWSRDMVADFGGRPSIKWGFGESALVLEDHVICTPAGKDVTCVALDRRTGEVAWKSRGLDQRHAMCSPAVLEYGQRRMIVTQLVRHIVGLSAEDGEILWRFEYIQDRHAEDAVKTFTPICADGRVVVACGRTQLGCVCLKATEDGRSVTPLWSKPGLHTGTWGAVLCDGRLYGAFGKGRWLCLDWSTGAVLHESDAIVDGRRGACVLAGKNLYCRGQNGRLDLVRLTADGLKVMGSFTIPASPTDKHWAAPALADGVLYIRHKDALLALDVGGTAGAGKRQ